MLTCPLSACDHAEQPHVGTLAAHLVEHHLLAPSEAMQRAREIADAAPTQPIPPPPRWTSAIRPWAQTKERPMPNETYTCSKCGAKGHNARSPECPEKGKPAPLKKACGYCKHTDHVYADCPMAPARRKGKKRRPFMLKTPKPAATTNGFASTLHVLRAEHADLTAAIAALERLEARGR